VAAASTSTLTADELKELKKKAYALLNRGDNKGAIEAAQKALEADPSDGAMYLYIGTAYQSLGKMKEMKEAFNDCVRKGKGPSVGECAMWGGKK
jgi:tetratricopeptide (TPR) repeat protein